MIVDTTDRIKNLTEADDEDEQDILLLYKDYLISRGIMFCVTATSALKLFPIMKDPSI
jgi:hypothetical protein